SEVIGTLPQDVPGPAPDLGGMAPETGEQPFPDAQGVDGNFPVQTETLPVPDPSAPLVEPVTVPPATAGDDRR
ncbi:MAG: hypothetical protein ACO3ZY_08950, partial [Phycisphaerales bacterium]